MESFASIVKVVLAIAPGFPLVIVPNPRITVSAFSGMSSGLIVAIAFWVRVVVRAGNVIVVVERV